MKKSILIFAFAILAAGAVALYHFYESIPVNKTLQISFISSQGREIGRTSLMKVAGKYHKNLLRPDTFFLNLEINGTEYEASNVMVNSSIINLEGIKSKFQGKPDGAFLTVQKDGKTGTSGYVEIYSGCSKIRGVVNSEMFVGPVSNYDEAQKTFKMFK